MLSEVCFATGCTTAGRSIPAIESDLRMLQKIFGPFFRLPHFKGKTRIETILCRSLWEPEVVRVRGGLKMVLDPVEWIQRQLLKKDWIEPRTIELYERLLTPGDVFVDVGAHVGFHGLVAAAKVGPSGIVIAIEPQPANVAKILVNARQNGFDMVRTVVGAAGAAPGHVWFHEQSPSDRALLSLDLDIGKNLKQVYRVPILRLDDVLSDVRDPKVIKVDVEGFELEVLEGLGDRINATEHLILEFLTNDPANDKSQKLVRFLSNAGFHLKTVTNTDWEIGQPLPENNVWACRA